MPRILIVEDSLDFRQSFREILFGRFPSMEFGEASDGKGALQKVDTFHPDIIFMDIKLPGENGLELTRKIKTDHPKIIVIVLTSYDLPEYQQAAYQCGANYFVSKDISIEELMKRVELILSESRLDGEGSGTD
jgi:DNA-binding NarL/FixJ family response regulator